MPPVSPSYDRFPRQQWTGQQDRVDYVSCDADVIYSRCCLRLMGVQPSLSNREKFAKFTIWNRSHDMDQVKDSWFRSILRLDRPESINRPLRFKEDPSVLRWGDASGDRTGPSFVSAVQVNPIYQSYAPPTPVIICSELLHPDQAADSFESSVTTTHHRRVLIER
jgi:hypothetical protein